MKLNKYLWELYIKSENGITALKKYSELSSKFMETPLKSVNIEIADELKHLYDFSSIDINIAQLIQLKFEKYQFQDLTIAYRQFEKELIENNISVEMPDKYGKMNTVYFFPECEEDLYDYVLEISFGLYAAQPNFFAPYSFRSKFNQLEESGIQYSISTCTREEYERKSWSLLFTNQSSMAGVSATAWLNTC